MYDQKTRRYYYYCAGTQTTVWHKPKDSEIIPLARLQVGWTWLSEIVQESPRYRGNLPISRMGHQISHSEESTHFGCVFGDYFCHENLMHFCGWISNSFVNRTQFKMIAHNYVWRLGASIKRFILRKKHCTNNMNKNKNSKNLTLNERKRDKIIII